MPSLREEVEKEPHVKAMEEFAKSIRGIVPPGVVPGTVAPVDISTMQRNAASTIPDSPVAKTPENVEQALLDQGMEPVAAFTPGRPLNPYFAYNGRPRGWNYQVGRNISTRPRQYRLPFETIRNLISKYDVAQICIRHIIDDLRSMPLLFSPLKGVRDDVTEEIQIARDFLAYPDGEHSWHEWLHLWMQDVLRYDGGCLYKRRDNSGKVIGLEVVDTTSIAPLIDYYGRKPAAPGPAYLQFVQGLPWDWITRDDMIYTRFNPMPEDVYGLAPIEAVLLTANTDLRFQWHFLQVFTEGTIPEGFMEAPPDQSSSDQIAEWQETWDAWLQGDQSQMTKLRWVPAGSKFTETKPKLFDPTFPTYLMRRTVAAFGLVPQDLGFTEDVNRSTGDTQTDVQFRISTMPKSIGAETVLNYVLQKDLGLRVHVTFDTGREREDRLMEAQAHQLYVFMGAESSDEVRRDVLGLDINPTERIPRFVMSERLGPIPLEYIISTGGQVDQLTGAPDPGTVVPTKFVVPGNQVPDPDADEETQNTTRQQLKDATNPMDSDPDPMKRQNIPELPAGGPAEEAADKDVQNVGSGDDIEDVADDTDAPRGRSSKMKKETFEVIDIADTAAVLRQWRTNSKNRIRQGKKPRRFTDPELPGELVDYIWHRLEKAEDVQSVEQAFGVEPLGKVQAGRPGPGGEREEDLVTHFTPLVQEAISEGLDASRIAKQWTFGQGDASSPNTPADTVAGINAKTTAAGLQTNPAKLTDVMDKIHRAAYGAGAKTGTDMLAPPAPDKDQAPQTGGVAQIVADALARENPTPISITGYDWDNWQPGDTSVADALDGDGMQNLQDTQRVQIKSITSTTRSRIATALADQVRHGTSVSQLTQALEKILHDSRRAQMIARTEVNRAMSIAIVDRLQAAGKTAWNWLEAPGACSVCQEEADMNPRPMGTVPPPAHPECRCTPSPAFTVR